MACPENPVKSNQAMPSPQPRKAILDTDVTPMANPKAKAQDRTTRWASNAMSTKTSAKAMGSTMGDSPKREIQIQKVLLLNMCTIAA